MWESPRDLLNGFNQNADNEVQVEVVSDEDEDMFGTLQRLVLNGSDQNVDSDINNEVQAEEVSDGNEELIGNWNKVTFAILQQRDWWHFAPALEICGTLNLREMIQCIWWKKFLSSKAFKR